MGAYSPSMEKPNGGKGRNRLWLVVLASFLMWFILLCFCFSGPMVGMPMVASFGDNFIKSVKFGDPSSIFLPGNSNKSNSKLHGKSFLSEEADFVKPVKDINVGDVVVKQDESNNWDVPFTNFSATDYGLESFDPVMIPGTEVQPTNQTNLAENELQSVARVSSSENEENSGEEVAINLNSSEPVVPLPLPENRNESTVTGTGREDGVDIDSDHDSCSGRYIYVHDLPSRFNEDLLKKCRSLSNWTNMCMFTTNMGLGPYLPGFKKGNSKSSWFGTNQFLLEVIFHNRIKQYECLTNDSSSASAIYVPFYAGLDVSRYLWYSNTSMRDAASLDLVKWLRERPEWKKMWGRDHFVVAGRITWDFRRLGEQDSDWGNRLMFLPESRNMTILVIESSPWNSNDFAIPYPTYFHPSTDNEVFEWQKSMRRQKRRTLFCFAGGPRPNLEDSIRTEIIEQCRASRKTCRLLECNDRGNKCHKPIYVMKMFQSSQFCLQPPGDSFTRRSAFDSILAGCIPVFFHPASAYVQYLWHLPKDHTKYSVFIPATEVKSGNASIEKILLRIPKEKVRAMRLEVIRQIPGVVYANPKSRLETLRDAFDITVKGVLERTERIRREMRMGKNTSFAFAEEFSWKYNLVGSVGKHEWDPFFTRK